MKLSFFITFALATSLAFAEEAEISDPLKNGDCFEYTDFKNEGKYKWVVGRVENLHLYRFEYQGTLFAKPKDKKQGSFVTYVFEMPYKKQKKFNKIACPKDLPKR